MCGITGMVSEGPAPPSLDVVRRMVAALAHRGPDSNGVECVGACVLGNTRLAIIDPSERGRQPMCNEDRSIWITYNGESYNARELRQGLEQRGHRFRSATDTEVVLHLHEEFGERCVEKLRGMFAFAIWDERQRRLLLARDRLGIKPLYYAETSRGLVFASEVKALLASGELPPRLDPAGLRAFLQLGHVPPPWTAIRGVSPLDPGHVAVWKDGRVATTPYWTLPAGPAPPTGSGAPGGPGRPPGGDRDGLAAELGGALLDTMRHHLVSDVPIVLFLSGGVDSACVAAAARQAGATNLTALTIGFPEAEFDESELSQRTANALGLPTKWSRSRRSGLLRASRAPSGRWISPPRTA